MCGFFANPPRSRTCINFKGCTGYIVTNRTYFVSTNNLQDRLGNVYFVVFSPAGVVIGFYVERAFESLTPGNYAAPYVRSKRNLLNSFPSL